MKNSLESIGQKPIVWRNHRLWLAGDHVVDPRVYEQPRVRALIEGMEEAKRSFKMTENQGFDVRTTPRLICVLDDLHSGDKSTPFCTPNVRERAEPGMLVIRSNSYT